MFGVDGEGNVIWLYDPEGGSNIEFFVEEQEDGSFQYYLSDGLRFISPGGELLSETTSSSGHYSHDGIKLPSGNIVMIGEEQQSLEVPPWEGMTTVSGNTLIELDSSGNTVWSWSSFDYLDTDRWPGELSTTLGMRGDADWTHANSLDYDAANDRFLLSLRHQNQVVAIDHATGDVEWLLGADSDFSLESGEWFASQHDAHLLPNGNLILFDNGNDKDAQVSRTAEYSLDESSMTATEVWSWDAELSSQTMGGAQRLDNGNTVVCASGQRGNNEDGVISEVTEDGEEIWQLRLGEGWWVYRATRVVEWEVAQ
jgi:hypothetical protein